MPRSSTSTLTELQRREALDEDFEYLVRRLCTEVTAHVDDKENTLFTRLREGVHPYVVEELGNKVRQAKKNAPARPHPGAPSTPL
ncbi:hypothetical protein [Streptomyces sp. NPDC020742]|uniref:hypothetical protein n=1 Tax=Streptomyces sp. NPDC020742 TaxID=3154897 RepID=UPI0033F510A4